VSWMTRGPDERRTRETEVRREVLRGPLPREGSAEEERAGILIHAFGVSTLFLMILVVLLAAATSYYAAYSGALRWILYALVVAVAGFVAVRALRGVVRDPARLAAKPTAAPVIGGELTSLRTTLQRASGGLAYSQVMFEERMREAFLEKVRTERDVPEDVLQAAVRNPEKIFAILRDRELAIFVAESERNSRMYPASVPTIEKRENFPARVKGLLDRMEAWH